MNKRLANKKVSDFTVGQLLEIFMVDVEKRINESQKLMIDSMPLVIRNEKSKERQDPKVVQSIIKTLFNQVGK